MSIPFLSLYYLYRNLKIQRRKQTDNINTLHNTLDFLYWEMPVRWINVCQLPVRCAFWVECVYQSVGVSPMMQLTGNLSGVLHPVHAGIDLTHWNSIMGYNISCAAHNLGKIVLDVFISLKKQFSFFLRFSKIFEFVATDNTKLVFFFVW